MSLRYSLFGVPCVFCDLPVDRIQMYVNAVVTVHEADYVPDCVFVHTVEPRAGGAVAEIPHAPASPVRSIRGAA